MRLHHFTDAWPDIDASNVILANWRGLAHLSITDDRTRLDLGHRDCRYRITVDLPDEDALPWKPWADAHLPPEELYSLTAPRLAQIRTRDDPPDAHPEEWFVVERPIPRAEWRIVTDLATGETLWAAPGQPV
jgi:hypothetical protein